MEGVNAFCAVHRALPIPITADGAPDLDFVVQFRGGYLVHKIEQVPPGGNAVLAYLDVVGHDDLGVAQLHMALDGIRNRIEQARSPVESRQNRVTARFAAITALEQDVAACLMVFGELRAAVEDLCHRPRALVPGAAGPFVIHARYGADGLTLSLPQETIERVPLHGMGRERIRLSSEDLAEPSVPFDLIRESAKSLLRISYDEIERAGGMKLVDPISSTVLFTYRK